MAYNIIEINGKRYDAVTGSYLGASQTSVKKAEIHHVRHAYHGPHKGPTGGSIDGFRRVPPSRTAGTPKPVPSVRAQAVVPAAAPSAPLKPIPPTAPVAPRPRRVPAQAAKAHAPQHATTLMRSSVKKPIIRSAEVIKSQTRTDLLARAPMQKVTPKLSYHNVDPVRRQRAERLLKSPAVSRFGSVQAQAATFTLAPLPMPVTRPVAAFKQSYAPSVAAQRAQTIPASNTRFEDARLQARLTRTDSRPPKPKPDIFQQALADAVAHEQAYVSKKPKARKHRHILRYVTGGLAVLLLAGFLAYNSGPALRLKIASYRSGLHASLPAAQPSGFKFGYLNYRPGNVTANFTSPADGRQFNIIQKASDWDSQALLHNFVAGVGTAYQTYSRAGRTVYVLSNNTATWVDSGIWYTVDGNYSLSNNQLLDLASSM